MSRAEVNFVPALLGAVLLWDFLTRVMQGVTMAFFEDVWTRNFLNFFATPLRISEYLTGLIIVAVGASALSLVVMVVFARAAFGLSFLAYGAALAPFIMVLFVTGIALGVFAAALVLRLGPASEWLIWPIPMIVSPFAGVFYPLAVLPGWMRAIAAILPPSYVFEGMRAVVSGRACAMEQACFRRRPRARLSRSRLPHVRRRLSHRHSHRPHRPLQRRDGELNPGHLRRPPRRRAKGARFAKATVDGVFGESVEAERPASRGTLVHLHGGVGAGNGLIGGDSLQTPADAGAFVYARTRT